jgi:hypothetical protein
MFSSVKASTEWLIDVTRDCHSIEHQMVKFRRQQGQRHLTGRNKSAAGCAHG